VVHQLSFYNTILKYQAKIIIISGKFLEIAPK